MVDVSSEFDVPAEHLVGSKNFSILRRSIGTSCAPEIDSISPYYDRAAGLFTN
jgi:hypothetical protein